jgi:hypothetical protein
MKKGALVEQDDVPPSQFAEMIGRAAADDPAADDDQAGRTGKKAIG